MGGEIRQFKKEEEIMAKLTKVDMKSIFCVLLGKPDSSLKTFHEKIIVSKQDIEDLNYKVQQKLENHNTIESLPSVVIAYEKGKIIEYGIWDTFKNESFNIPEVIESIAIKWDFLVKIPNYNVPQRHVMVVKISPSPSPIQFLRTIFSENADNADKFEQEAAPCCVRVDFISHILADELIKIVGDWNRNLEKPEHLHKIKKFFRSKRFHIARFIHYSFPCFGAVLGLLLINKYFHSLLPEKMINILDVTYIINYLSVTVLVSFVLLRLGYNIASKAFSSLEKLDENHFFNITNGDKKRAEEIKFKNNNSLTKSISMFVITFLYDLFMSAAAINIWSFIKK